MKITISYDYIQSNDFPFTVKAFNEDGYVEAKVSDISFDDAKSKLMESLRTKIERVPPIIPESEEIEL